MKNVFTYPILGGKERLRDNNNVALHPTQKPVDLIRKLIKVHSNQNELIVDCFMGSGTTALASKQLGRNFIGCDINEDYVKIANRRLEQSILEV